MNTSNLSNRDEIELHWLDQELSIKGNVGTTWGVPWYRGQLKRDEQIELVASDGKIAPLQTRPMAYWPDGSVKWTAHSAEVNYTATASYLLRRTTQKQQSSLSFVTQNENEIIVKGERIICHIPRSGTAIISSLSLADQAATVLASNGRLKLNMLDAPERELASVQYYGSSLEQVEVEEAGAVRAVIVIKGKHQLNKETMQSSDNRGNRAEASTTSIPFIVRLIFYKSQANIQLKHTLLIDVEPNKQFISGVGISFDVAMKGELYNRHIRMAGDHGWFSEAARGVMTAKLPPAIVEKYREHHQGKQIYWNQEVDEEFRYSQLLEDVAVWNDFKLVQLSPDSYRIAKRTSAAGAWIRALYGQRARGLMYVGSELGGLAIGLKHFWQLCPSGMEARGLASERAEVTLWLWSPESEPMDLRHYDTLTHVESSYEGAKELRSTPYGIGHTSDCMLYLSAHTPDFEQLEQLAQQCEYEPLLVCSAYRYQDAGVFGRYSLPNYSTEQHAAMEQTLESIWQYYNQEIEQRKWYGFWDFGDIMHSYDLVRHTWKYDIGGCAWQNTELVPNKWLWYSFLRTGRKELFYMAEAMTRHTSETDLYHFGPYAGLGSRHNVLHYGCGCKEARIGMAGLHRFYYYLTADARIGDIMDEVKDADYATVALDPMRAYFPKDEFVTHARSGPDWSAFCSNWLVQWERYESEHYRNKISAGIQSIKRMPHRLLDGPAFGYDPDKGELSYMGHENYDYHLMICMGGAQVWMELAELLDDEEWSNILAEYGAFYNLSTEEKGRLTNQAFVGKRWSIPMLSTSLMAFAAKHQQNNELGKEAWSYLMTVRDHWQIGSLEPNVVPLLEFPYAIHEVPWLSTNTASQWSLNTIFCKQYIGELI